MSDTKLKKDKLLLKRRVKIWSGLILSVRRSMISPGEGRSINDNPRIYLAASSKRNISQHAAQ